MKITNIKKEYKTTAMAESATVQGAFYLLTFQNGQYTCTCPSHLKSGEWECKHIKAFKEELEFIRAQRESK